VMLAPASCSARSPARWSWPSSRPAIQAADARWPMTLTSYGHPPEGSRPPSRRPPPLL